MCSLGNICQNCSSAKPLLHQYLIYTDMLSFLYMKPICATACHSAVQHCRCPQWIGNALSLGNSLCLCISIGGFIKIGCCFDRWAAQILLGRGLFSPFVLWDTVTFLSPHLWRALSIKGKTGNPALGPVHTGRFGCEVDWAIKGLLWLRGEVMCYLVCSFYSNSKWPLVTQAAAD